MSYELRKIVCQVLDTTSITDPAEVALKVAEVVPAKELRAALAEALAHYVATVNQQRRMGNPILRGEEPSKPVRSQKVAGIAAWHAAALADRVSVAGGGWKVLGDCTYEDLMFNAEMRRDLARRNAVKADQYEALARRLVVLGVETVAQLPVSEFDGLGAAA